jgi:glycerol 3-phosphatase-1
MANVSNSLFDMDGTLVDSTAGVIGAWQTFANSYPDIDVQKILSCKLR